MSARPKITRAARERIEAELEVCESIKRGWQEDPRISLARAYARDVRMLLGIADRAIAAHPRRNGKGEPCGT